MMTDRSGLGACSMTGFDISDVNLLQALLINNKLVILNAVRQLRDPVGKLSSTSC
jgi:hypothetical protein